MNPSNPIQTGAMLNPPPSGPGQQQQHRMSHLQSSAFASTPGLALYGQQQQQQQMPNLFPSAGGPILGARKTSLMMPNPNVSSQQLGYNTVAFQSSNGGQGPSYSAPLFPSSLGSTAGFPGTSAAHDFPDPQQLYLDPMHSVASHIGWAPSSPLELKYYDDLFEVADVGKQGLLQGKVAFDFFTKSHLDKGILRQIWTTSDVRHQNSLGRNEFYLAMRLVAMAQSGEQLLSLERVRETSDAALPLPRFMDAPQPPPSLVAEFAQRRSGMQNSSQKRSIAGTAYQLQSDTGDHLGLPSIQSAQQFGSSSRGMPQNAYFPAPLGDTSDSDKWAIAPSELTKYEALFSQYDVDKDGFILGKDAYTLFSQSKVSPPMLKQIYLLADRDKDTRLDKLEFCIAMHLIVCSKRWSLQTLPESLPPPLANLGREQPSNMSPTFGSFPSFNLPTLQPTIDSSPPNLGHMQYASSENLGSQNISKTTSAGDAFSSLGSPALDLPLQDLSLVRIGGMSTTPNAVVTGPSGGSSMLGMGGLSSTSFFSDSPTTSADSIKSVHPSSTDMMFKAPLDGNLDRASVLRASLAAGPQQTGSPTLPQQQIYTGNTFSSQQQPSRHLDDFGFSGAPSGGTNPTDMHYPQAELMLSSAPLQTSASTSRDTPVSVNSNAMNTAFSTFSDFGNSSNRGTSGPQLTLGRDSSTPTSFTPTTFATSEIGVTTPGKSMEVLQRKEIPTIHSQLRLQLQNALNKLSNVSSSLEKEHKIFSSLEKKRIEVWNELSATVGEKEVRLSWLHRREAINAILEAQQHNQRENQAGTAHLEQTRALAGLRRSLENFASSEKEKYTAILEKINRIPGSGLRLGEHKTPVSNHSGLFESFA